MAAASVETTLGQIGIANASVRELLINPLYDVNRNDMPLLGAPFLSSTYLLVDHDRQAFTLWSSNAVPEQRLVVPGSPDPALCRSGNSSRSSEEPTPLSPAPSGSAIPLRPNPKSTSLPVAVIASASVFAGLVILGVLLTLWRKCIKRKRADDGTAAEMGLKSPTLDGSDPPPAELSADTPPLELSSGGASPPVELPSESERQVKEPEHAVRVPRKPILSSGKGSST
jgi:hypothetical protein